MKKGLAIVLSLMLAAVLVSGLSAQKKVSVWCWDPNFNGSSMKSAAAVYNKAHSDVTIEVVDIPQDIDAKIDDGDLRVCRMQFSVNRDRFLQFLGVILSKRDDDDDVCRRRTSSAWAGRACARPGSTRSTTHARSR